MPGRASGIIYYVCRRPFGREARPGVVVPWCRWEEKWSRSKYCLLCLSCQNTNENEYITVTPELGAMREMVWTYTEEG